MRKTLTSIAASFIIGGCGGLVTRVSTEEISSDNKISYEDNQKRVLCDSNLRDNNTYCNSTKEGLALNQCAVQLEVVAEGLQSIYRSGISGECGILNEDGSSTFDDKNDEVESHPAVKLFNMANKLLAEKIAPLSQAEKEHCYRTLSREYIQKSTEAEIEYRSCIQPSKAIYDSCKETARSTYLRCLNK